LGDAAVTGDFELDEGMEVVQDGEEAAPNVCSPSPVRARKKPANRETTNVDPWSAEVFGTVHDVARMMKLHWKTVERLRRKSGLPFVRIGGALRYPFSDVLRWASARREGV
jgi:excisionase family DNA binding protein